MRSGIELELIKWPYPEWTIARCNEAMYVYKEDRRLAENLESCELLAKIDRWTQIQTSRSAPLSGQRFGMT